jgi:hypothetical protein
MNQAMNARMPASRNKAYVGCPNGYKKREISSDSIWPVTLWKRLGYKLDLIISANVPFTKIYPLMATGLESLMLGISIRHLISPCE